MWQGAKCMRGLTGRNSYWCSHTHTFSFYIQYIHVHSYTHTFSFYIQYIHFHSYTHTFSFYIHIFSLSYTYIFTFIHFALKLSYFNPHIHTLSLTYLYIFHSHIQVDTNTVFRLYWAATFFNLKAVLLLHFYQN